jgi:hypothetical protein
MAHFAKLDENNIVLATHVVSNDVITVDGIESEKAGIDFLKELHGHENWKQTSYNGTIRHNYAGVGYKYDPVFNAFIPPRPYPSWKLNYTTYQWYAPIPVPQGIEGFEWRWSEINQEWVKAEGPNG